MLAFGAVAAVEKKEGEIEGTEKENIILINKLSKFIPLLCEEGSKTPDSAFRASCKRVSLYTDRVVSSSSEMVFLNSKTLGINVGSEERELEEEGAGIEASGQRIGIGVERLTTSLVLLLVDFCGDEGEEFGR